VIEVTPKLTPKRMDATHVGWTSMDRITQQIVFWHPAASTRSGLPTVRNQQVRGSRRAVTPRSSSSSNVHLTAHPDWVGYQPL
jgi:hypothetical protein